ncbi:hypothetical protein [uncultured Brachyspira sp.]|uniref:hypothetical protein n=1 Tax=uncultured Brachyspira sp. TaxID=221953 RepID=UPI002621B308|nr:hypothetical protein [uncultured Brachyspira sp.]
MEENKNEIANINFELVESEEEKKYLIENLDKFEIVSFENLDLSNISDSIVKSAYEIFKNGILLNRTSELLKCSAPLNELMRYKDGSYGGAIINQTSKRIEAQAHFTPIAGSAAAFVGVTMALQVASIALGQYFMFQINEKLTVILKYIKEISAKLEYKEIASFKTVVSELSELKDKKNITEQDINNLIDLRKRAKDVLFYYEQKIMNKNEDSITFENKQKFMKRVEKLIENIGEFDLDYYMYKAVSEVLIYIDIFLYNSYIKTSNFKDAELVLEKMKNYDNLFEDKIKEKIKNLLNKMIDQFNYIYDHRDHLKEKFSMAAVFLLTPLAPIAINAIKTDEDAINFLNDEIKKYDNIRYEMHHPNNEAVNLVKNITNEVNKDRLVYHFNYDDKEYAFIEE